MIAWRIVGVASGVPRMEPFVIVTDSGDEHEAIRKAQHVLIDLADGRGGGKLEIEVREVERLGVIYGTGGNA